MTRESSGILAALRDDDHETFAVVCDKMRRMTRRRMRGERAGLKRDWSFARAWLDRELGVGARETP